jgi:hypothetical protein
MGRFSGQAYGERDRGRCAFYGCNRGRQANSRSTVRLRVRNPRGFILACFSKASIVVRVFITRVERGFAAFADVPCLDPLTHQDLVLLMDDWEFTSRPNDPTSALADAVAQLVEDLRQ